MKRLLINALVFSAPILFLVLFYILTDPFKVIYSYNAYFNDQEPIGTGLNKDYVSVESFLRNREIFHYNSFIFGSSRSMFYQVADWQPYIGPAASCFHFDANSETLYGIYRKLVLIDSLHTPIRNALFILDEEILGQTKNSEGHLFIKHYLMTGETRFSFQLDFFKAFITTPKFIFADLDYKLSGKLKPYMFSDHMFSKIRAGYKTNSNEMTFASLEDSVTHDPEDYYANKRYIFDRSDTIPTASVPVIKKEQEIQLRAIADILKKNGTNFRIVVSPLYDQKRISTNDLDVLKQYFGAQNVFDFSGVNKYTSDKTNYYEASHYRPLVARDILRQVYQ